MARATTRLTASAHWSLLNLHHVLLPTTTTPATFIRQAAYSTRKHASASERGNAKNNEHNNSDNLSKSGRINMLQHTPSRQHKTSEPSPQNKHRTHNSSTKPKQPDTTKGSTRSPPTPLKVDHSQQKMVTDQWIKEPLLESQIETTSREPSRPLPVAPPPRANRAWDHTAATTERLYRPGYKNAEKHADRILRADFMMASTSPHIAGPESMTQRSSDDTSRKQEPRRSNSASPAAGHLYPTNFRTVPDTERIESADKEGVQRLFTKRSGTRTIQTDAFSLKSARMIFLEPPVPNVPKFVEKAMEEYNQAMTAYRLNQHKLNKTTEKSTEKDATTDSITPSTVTEAPLPIPKPSPFIRQYSLRNLRRYPATVDAPHPPYRVVYVISKKVVSKLAVHRNLCRKKLSAAVEAVLREYARPGYEFMFFAKQQCVTTSQMDLEEMLIKTLMDPNLYADTALRNKGRYATPVRPFGQVAATTATAMSSLQPSPLITQDFEVAKKSAVKIRWKNNQAPLKWNWWKHALPNPLGRTRQPDEYLDMHCPKPPGDKSTVDSAGHENAPSAESKK